jgi:hypothetical protein
MAQSEALIAEILIREELEDEIRYGVGIPKRVDDALKQIPELQKNLDSLSKMRLDLITQFLFSNELIPLGIIPDSEQRIWDTEESLEERWRTEHARDKKVSRAAKEIIWYGAGKYYKRAEEVVPTLEMINDYCKNYNLPNEVKERLIKIIL